MEKICQHLQGRVGEILEEWEDLVRDQPWFSLPPDHRIDDLPLVIIGLVEASICNPSDERAHRQSVSAACSHGTSRRQQGIPEHLMFTEYHLLRQAIWHELNRSFSPVETTHAIMRIDAAVTLATNASMWGYHRAEIEAMGRWQEGMERIIRSSPFLRGGPGNSPGDRDA
jgi:hypothetical protein